MIVTCARKENGLIQPNILLCNDDGIDSPGLFALENQFRDKANLFTVAPSKEQSAVGHSITLHDTLRKQRLSDNKYSVNGTPTDCILIALKNILPWKPDMIISGINKGPNLGADVTYSGTVAAALEGALLGINSVAVSLNDRETDNFQAAAQITEKIVNLVLENGLPANTLLNINIPFLPLEKIRNHRITHLGKRIYNEEVIRKVDPRGREYFWIGGGDPGFIIEPGTDFEALENNEVSITPLHFDSTNYSVFDELGKWLIKNTM